MYSAEIEKVLSASGIKTGDGVKITSQKGTMEGVLMPRPDVGNKSILVIKRKDGYNVGIEYGKGFKIQKTESARESFSFPKADTKNLGKLPKVALIYTGGTIGSKVDYVSGGVYMLTKPEELLFEVPELKEIADIRVTNLTSISSEDMTATEWKGIAEAVVKAFGNGARGVVVTLGTDTMHYTAAALSFMLQDLNGPVILTGAQRSSDRGSSDAFLNLVCAVTLAANSDVAEVGICMHADSSDRSCMLIRGTKARKMHTSRRDAFRPVNSDPIAKVKSDLSIEYVSDYKRVAKSSKKARALAEFEERTALVKFYPNSDPGILDHYVGEGYKGIIIEGTGLGHVAASPTRKELSWIDHIKRAVDSGTIVGMTSQCIYGRVNSNVYKGGRMAASAGAIYCQDMTPETAYVKLGFLLGNYKREKAAELLDKNIAGEIDSRIDLDSFIE